ncbi:N-acyl-phosphatidylethanolamine-hydrolyzing phospholipase D [Flagelloscypha sp. PMI_526]|nr:N-acyl-phosphatidylethanolamine-hydrolyzing phospholipase D [Flagelloscypha sp. PMI_526]
MPSSSPTIQVFATESETSRRKALPKTRPSHWDNDTGIGFNNPWESCRDVKSFLSRPVFRAFYQSTWKMLNVKTDHAKSAIGVQTPTWGHEDPAASTKIRATWLGHACFFVQMPGSASSRGANILFDPIFSDRCSPNQHMGPKRYTPPPCTIEDIPEVDAVVISHNHYDHLDTHTIKALAKRVHPPHFFAPLGNEPYFTAHGIPKTHIHVLDWWESLRLQADNFSVDITCTPSQHRTGRSMRDQMKTLWASWVVEGIEMNGSGGGKVYFAGDTAYRAINDDDKLDDESLPFCPAFKEIGERWKGFDFAMIPIGAYLPGVFMSSQHVSPPQSVHIFEDIQARNALGMHWGTWVMTMEEVMEPPQLLRDSLKERGIEDDKFTVCSIGETRVYDIMKE